METSMGTHDITHLLPVIRARRGEIEQGRRMPRDLIDRIRTTGVFRMGVPRALGGDEAVPMEIIPAGHRPDPPYQMPPMGLFVFQLASVSLGIARGALDELTEIAQRKVSTLYTSVLADRAAAQSELARAEAALGGARAFLYETVHDIWQTVCDGRQPGRRQIALGRAACGGRRVRDLPLRRAAGALARRPARARVTADR